MLGKLIYNITKFWDESWEVAVSTMHPLAKFVRIFCKYNGEQMDYNQ